MKIYTIRKKGFKGTLGRFKTLSRALHALRQAPKGSYVTDVKGAKLTHFKGGAVIQAPTDSLASAEAAKSKRKAKGQW